jgi:hypothetical protein
VRVVGSSKNNGVKNNQKLGLTVLIYHQDPFQWVTQSWPDVGIDYRCDNEKKNL